MAASRAVHELVPPGETRPGMTRNECSTGPAPAEPLACGVRLADRGVAMSGIVRKTSGARFRGPRVRAALGAVTAGAVRSAAWSPPWNASTGRTSALPSSRWDPPGPRGPRSPSATARHGPRRRFRWPWPPGASTPGAPSPPPG
ncbi:hypothetical protein FM114_01030 [Luteococcus japonicus LSP_Lj1]|uniref:Uncharacterized protein n=1 Tax=Luteococcus japonicus LSP_Lj1 TaxID=1255658 RepID=A0A1R4ICF0_9ACTN|nr:hypothetical protein FM114_01030 [Luteococcus japonicus LSP_Lj1]